MSLNPLPPPWRLTAAASSPATTAGGCPPRRTTACCGCTACGGAAAATRTSDPQDPRPARASAAASLLPTMPLGQIDKRTSIKLACRYRCHATGRDRHQARRAAAAVQGCPLAEHRTRPVLGQPLAVVLDAHHAIQHEE